MKSNHGKWSALLLAILVCATVPQAQQTGAKPPSAQQAPQATAPQQTQSPEAAAIVAAIPTDKKIMAEIHDHNELEKNEEHLADDIGARLTGSHNLDVASHWTLQKFKDYGLDNVHLEAWEIAHTWTRGPVQGRIITPMEHNLTFASAAWAAGTNGAARGPVVYVNATKEEDLPQYAGKLKSAWIILNPPREFDPPGNPALVPFGDPVVPINIPKASQAQSYGPKFYQFMRALYMFAAKEGASGVIFSSDKKYDLLNMLSIGGPMYMANPVPTEILAWEDYNLIWRLMQKGPVEIELNVQNSFGDKATVYNTVAEITGVEKPDEIVVLGAHLDSWDLGTGATDNGTGAMAVLEAARALKAAGVKPKRTIRFILFSGEEQGLVGSQHYVEEHGNELSKFSAALIHDTGTGKVVSIGMMGNYQDREVMDLVVTPLHDLGLLELSLREMGGSDHASFDRAGVPGFWVIQDPMDYNMTHHSQADTFDRVNFEDLAQGAQVLAVWAYNVAQLPELLPRKPQPTTGTGGPAVPPPPPAVPPLQTPPNTGVAPPNGAAPRPR